MKKTNAAVNLAEGATATEATGNQEQPKEATAVPEAKKQEKPKTPAELFLASLAKTALEKTVKDGHEIRAKLTNEEIHELMQGEAPKFRQMGEMEETGLQMSSERYAVWAPVFPIGLDVNGEPAISKFGQRIYNMLDDADKTPDEKTAGKFATCQTAARYRNPHARGIVSMCRWITRNKATLFPHLGVKAVDEDTKALNKVVNAVETLSTYVEDFSYQFLRVNEKHEPILDEATGEPQFMTVADIIRLVNLEKIKPLADAIKTDKEAEKADRKKAIEAEEKALATPEEKKNADYAGPVPAAEEAK